jgi:hypothetical protein
MDFYTTILREKAKRLKGKSKEYARWHIFKTNVAIHKPRVVNVSII